MEVGGCDDEVGDGGDGDWCCQICGAGACEGGDGGGYGFGVLGREFPFPVIDSILGDLLMGEKDEEYGGFCDVGG